MQSNPFASNPGYSSRSIHRAGATRNKHNAFLSGFCCYRQTDPAILGDESMAMPVLAGAPYCIRSEAI